MFKRSNSKTSTGSGNQKSPQIRPQYTNAANRKGGAAVDVSLTIPSDHAALLAEIAASGRVPASTSWEAIRDDVCRPLIERLLAVSLQSRSDALLPNGQWVGSGASPASAAANNSDDVATDGKKRGGSAGAAKGSAAAAKSGKGGSDSDSDNANASSSAAGGAASAAGGSSAMPMDIVPAVLDSADFESENDYIIDQWCALPGPTFTLQRLAEILLAHRRFHCFCGEQPYGPAAIALGGATVDIVGSSGTGGAGKALSEATGANGSDEAAAAEPPKSPRSRGILRGEKLQAAIRRCVLVATLDTL